MGSETKFTPGPWRVEGHLSGVPRGHIISHGVNHEGDGPEGYICDAYGTNDADARLIAAAPDLLEALKSCEAWLTSWGQHVETCPGHPFDIAVKLGRACTCGLEAMRHEARAALAKVEG